jgi:hypothetical protein
MRHKEDKVYDLGVLIFYLKFNRKPLKDFKKKSDLGDCNFKSII